MQSRTYLQNVDYISISFIFYKEKLDDISFRIVRMMQTIAPQSVEGLGAIYCSVISAFPKQPAVKSAQICALKGILIQLQMRRERRFIASSNVHQQCQKKLHCTHNTIKMQLLEKKSGHETLA